MYRFQPDPEATAGDSDIPGTTTVQDAVIGKVIGLSASRVPGVHALGDGTARALGLLRDALGQTDLSQGVSVTNDDGRVSVQAVIVVEFPHPVQDVAAGVRTEIANAIGVTLGMTVGEIDVTVNDVHVTEPDDVSNDAAPGGTHSGPAADTAQGDTDDDPVAADDLTDTTTEEHPR